MSVRSSATGVATRALQILGSARMTSAISVASIGTAFTAYIVRDLIGWAGLGGAIFVLAALAGASLFAKRHTLEWRGLLPISLLIFVFWCCLTLIWSDHHWATISGLAYQIALCLLGVYVALTRDLIQIIRAVGDVTRFALAVSLIVEVFSGLLIDMPIKFLGIDGSLATGGPVQGIYGDRNQLGFVALIGAITFATELATKSVTLTTTVFSFCLAVVGIAFTRSPVVFVGILLVGVAALVLLGLRALHPSSRRYWQFGLLGSSVVGLFVAWILRAPIIALLNAGTEFEVRYSLWRDVLGYVAIKPLEGWGWVGLWRAELQPFQGINIVETHVNRTALNAFVDVMFQTGLVGLFCFLVLIALGFSRSWLLASNQRGIEFTWPALVFVALISTAAAESIVLVEYGWLLLVICSVSAAGRLSWRRGFVEEPAGVHS